MSRTETGSLEDHHGNPYSMRLMSITSLAASITFGLVSVLHSGAQSGPMGSTSRWRSSSPPSLRKLSRSSPRRSSPSRPPERELRSKWQATGLGRPRPVNSS